MGNRKSKWEIHGIPIRRYGGPISLNKPVSVQLHQACDSYCNSHSRTNSAEGPILCSVTIAALHRILACKLRLLRLYALGGYFEVLDQQGPGAVPRRPFLGRTPYVSLLS